MTLKKPIFFLTAALLATVGAAAGAQEYPNRTVKVVVPYSAGGPADAVARILAQGMTRQLGQPVIVENKAGAAGAIGVDFVAESAPDGYTALFTASPTFNISPHITKSLPYDPLTDFTPIATVVDYTSVLVVNPKLPVKTVAELVRYAKDNPGKVAYSSSGVGSSNHLAGELLANATGTNMLHVPYKGNAPAMTAVITGEVAYMFDSTGTAINFIRGGRVNALAVTSVGRNNMLPHLPTMIEAGTPGFDVVGWYGFLGPAKLPRPVVARFDQAVKTVLSDRAVEQELLKQGFDIKVNSSEQFAARIKREYDLWGKVVRDAKIEKN
jgi:tripartite-type tricarboxylate transporter receptor subunit TctC